MTYISVAMMNSSTMLDWIGHRIIDDSIFKYPGARFPVRLFSDLKEIDFVCEKFLALNRPEEYLGFKYNEDWMIPKKTGYEKDVVQLIPEGPISGHAGRLRQFLTKHLLKSRAGRLRSLPSRASRFPAPRW